MNRIPQWLGAAAATVAGGLVLGAFGLPSSYLFAALLVGLAIALAAPGRLAMPEPGFRLAQAVTGVALGTYLRSSTLGGVGAHWPAVVLVSVGTLALSILAGLALARISDLDAPTASLGMVAGGASGIVGMAGELGGDDRLVAFMQYFRVLVVTLLTPVLVPLLFGVHGRGARAAAEPLLGTPGGWLFTIVAAAAGMWLGPRLRLPAPALLGPLALTAGLTVGGLTGELAVPPLLRESAFAAIGLKIGLGFDRVTLARVARTTPAVGVTIAGLLIISFGFGWLLELTASVSLLDGYLATTPGGLYAVLPIAAGSGANLTFVLAVQALRLVAMLAAAPVVIRLLLRPP